MVHRLTPEHLTALYSGPKTKAYVAFTAIAQVQDGIALPVSCYNLPPEPDADFNAAYRAKLIAAARKAALPEAYVNGLESLQP